MRADVFVEFRALLATGFPSFPTAGLAVVVVPCVAGVLPVVFTGVVPGLGVACPGGSISLKIYIYTLILGGVEVNGGYLWSGLLGILVAGSGRWLVVGCCWPLFVHL